MAFPVILDGATGSALQQRGMPAGVCPELWILEHPEILIGLQHEYIDAGSDIIFAPTFGANSAALSRNGIEGRTAEINAALVALSKSAAAGKALVAGDIAPTGLQLTPYGSSNFDEVFSIYREQALALEDAGVDAFAVETSVSLAEARAAVIAVKEVSEKPVFMSFSVGASGCSLYGSDLSAALVTAQALGVSAFGINCCNDFALMTALFQKIGRYARIPLLSKPNAGLPEIIDGEAHYCLSPEKFAAFTSTLGALGVGFMGGCCGTTPEHIRALNAAVSGQSVAPPAGKDNEIFCACERAALSFTAETRTADITCTEDLLEDAAEAQSEGAELIRLSIPDGEALSCFLESAPLMKLPLCISAESEDVLAKAVRNYCGVVLCGMPETPTLSSLSRKYGLVLI